MNGSDHLVAQMMGRSGERKARGRIYGRAVGFQSNRILC